jgi:hypothetical protein
MAEHSYGLEYRLKKPAFLGRAGRLGRMAFMTGRSSLAGPFEYPRIRRPLRFRPQIHALARIVAP